MNETDSEISMGKKLPLPLFLLLHTETAGYQTTAVAFEEEQTQLQQSSSHQ